MANRYIDSAATGANDGTTWADAYTTSTACAAADSAGDDIFIASTSSEAAIGNGIVSLAWAGTATAPTKIWSVDKTGSPQPPDSTDLLAGATIPLQGNTNSEVYFVGNLYVYGVNFPTQGGNSACQYNFFTSDATAIFDTCQFNMSSTTGATSCINVGKDRTGDSGHVVQWKNCGVKFGATGQGIYVRQAKFHWNGGSLLSGGTVPTSLFIAVGASAQCRSTSALVENIDLSNASTTMNLIGNAYGSTEFTFRNIKLPTSWAGNLVNSGHDKGAVVRLHNYTIGTTEYLMWEKRWNGTIKSDTAHYRTGGATDGTTAHSWLMTSTANVGFPVSYFESPEIVRWNETTGSAVTVTVHVAQEGGTNLNDNELWIEVNYLGTSGTYQGVLDVDDKCGLLATPAAQTSSSETWTGFTSATKQQLSATFTPQEKGFIYVKVHLAKASTSVYVCPKLVIS